MDTFPYTSLGRRYTRGYPNERIIDTGMVPLRLGNGVLRVRDWLGQAIVGYDCRLDQLTLTAVEIFKTFYDNHRGAAFYWTHPVTELTYESLFDPETPYLLTPDPMRRSQYSLDFTILPAVPTAAVD